MQHHLGRVVTCGYAFQRRLQVKENVNGNEIKVMLACLPSLMINNLAKGPGRGLKDKQRKLARSLRLESHSLKGEISGEVV